LELLIRSWSGRSQSGDRLGQGPALLVKVHISDVAGEVLEPKVLHLAEQAN